MNKTLAILFIITAFVGGSITTGAIVFAHGGDITLIHSCVAKTGSIKIVPATTSCKSGETALDWNIAGKSSLTKLTDESAGANCPDGGVKIETGVDDNNNGTLEVGEVDDTKYVCDGASAPICGDGVITGSETCDDGDALSGDGCSSTCQTESNYSCVGVPSVCTSSCGNGVIDGTEQCDGIDLGGSECSTFTFPGGTLACSDQCTFDFTSCTG